MVVNCMYYWNKIIILVKHYNETTIHYYERGTTLIYFGYFTKNEGITVTFTTLGFDVYQLVFHVRSNAMLASTN